LLQIKLTVAPINQIFKRTDGPFAAIRAAVAIRPALKNDILMAKACEKERQYRRTFLQRWTILTKSLQVLAINLPEQQE